MIRSPFLAGAMLLFVSSGCSKSSTSGPLPGAFADADTPIKVGDHVVVESAAATFVEGVVSAVVRDRVNVALAPTRGSLERLQSDVYVVPPTARASPPEPGTYGICRMRDDHWRACRVETATRTGASVVDDDATPAVIGWGAFLSPTPLTDLNVRQRFDRNAKRRAFRHGAHAAGRPRCPHGWHPAIEELVLAQRDGVWVGAKVRGLLKKGVVRIVWDDDKRLADLSAKEIVPQPPVDFAPTVGSFVLARPQAGEPAWTVVRVESTGGMNLVVSNEVGDQIRTTTRDVLALDRGDDPGSSGSGAK
jgi:hypothetical protein